MRSYDDASQDEFFRLSTSVCARTHAPDYLRHCRRACCHGVGLHSRLRLLSRRRRLPRRNLLFLPNLRHAATPTPFPTPTQLSVLRTNVHFSLPRFRVRLDVPDGPAALRPRVRVRMWGAERPGVRGAISRHADIRGYPRMSAFWSVRVCDTDDEGCPCGTLLLRPAQCTLLLHFLLTSPRPVSHGCCHCCLPPQHRTTPHNRLRTRPSPTALPTSFPPVERSTPAPGSTRQRASSPQNTSGVNNGPKHRPPAAAGQRRRHRHSRSASPQSAGGGSRTPISKHTQH